MGKNLSPLKIGALLTYFSIGFNIVAGLIYTPWMIRQIGQSDYGLYTLANSLISLFLIDFGLSSATARFVAKYRIENDEEGMQNFLSAVYKLYIVIDAIIFLVLVGIYLFIDVFYQNFTVEEIEKFKVVFCIAGLYSLFSFPCVTFNGILTAYEKFVPLKVADVIQRVGCIALTVLALLMDKGLYSLVVVNAFMGLTAIVIKFIYVRKSVKIRFVKTPISVYKGIFAFSLWSTVWTLSQRLIFNITPTIIGSTVAAASSAIAVFGIITTIESYFYNVTTAVNGMFISRITRIIQDDPDGKKITALTTKVGKFQFALNGLIILAFFIIGKEFILLWMGEDYIQAYYGIMLVASPGLFYNSLQIANSTMVAKNLVKEQAYIHIIMGICNVILSVIFSSLWGVIGASLSICIAYYLRVVLTLIVIKRKLNINLKEYIKKCYVKMLVPLVLSCIVCLFVLVPFEASSWLILAVKGACVTGIYLIAVVFLGLDKNERKEILKYKKGL